MREKEPIAAVQDESFARRLGSAVLSGLRAMGKGFEAQNVDRVGTRAIAADVLTGRLEQADIALKFTPVPDTPPRDLDS